MDSESKPWIRRPDEPEQAYVGFLFNRNLGPNRSLSRAYRRYVTETGLAPKGTEPEQAPGQWRQFSVQFDWVHRAREWDIWRLQTYGSRIAVLYTHKLERALERHAEALDEYAIGDDEWYVILKTFDSLGGQLEIVREGIKRAEREDHGSRIRGDEPSQSDAEIVITSDEPTAT
jgi:hypothetical protein